MTGNIQPAKVAERMDHETLYHLVKVMGVGVNPDIKQAHYWYRQALDYNNPQAMMGLANLYYKAKDYTEAVRWFEMAGVNGVAAGYANLGYIYHNGNGVDRDCDRAVAYYEKAAIMGDAASIHNLGVIMNTYKPMRLGIMLKRPQIPLLFTILSLVCWLVIGCSGNPKRSQVIIAPAGSTPTIAEATIATTQTSQNLHVASTQLADSNQRLGSVAEEIQHDAIAGRAKTPQGAESLFPIWDSIWLKAYGLLDIKSVNDRINEQIKEQKQRLDQLAGMLERAKVAEAEKEKFWKGREAENQRQMDKRDAKIVELNASLSSQIRGKFMWLAVAATAGIGLSIVAGVFLDKKIAKAGAIGFGVILAISLFVGETLWMVPWAAGIIFILTIAYIIWQVVVHKRAVHDLVQSGEIMLQNIPKSRQLQVSGHGAVHGDLDKVQTPSTRRLVKLYRTKVRPRKMPDELGSHPALIFG